MSSARKKLEKHATELDEELDEYVPTHTSKGQIDHYI